MHLHALLRVGEFYEDGPRLRRPPVKWPAIAESLRNTVTSVSFMKKLEPCKSYMVSTSKLLSSPQSHGNIRGCSTARHFKVHVWCGFCDK
jgi:hypothetical protein